MSPTKAAHPFARLREAREARCMSLEDLAQIVGTSRQLLYHYERGNHVPRRDTVARLCTALRVPIEFFSTPEPEPEPSPTFWRKLTSKARAKHLLATAHQRLWARDLVSAVECSVVFPEPDIPDFHPPSDPREISDEQIEDAATALRRHWGFGDGAIRDVIKLIENKGCVVIQNLLEDDTDAIDAFSWWSRKGRPFIVIGCRPVSGAHSRLDSAHELGHLILHRNVDKRFLELNPETHRLIEKQAFRFAGAFLMPATTFRRSAPSVTLDTLLMVKPQWFLSVAAMLQRSEDVGTIDHETFVRFRKMLIRRGWTVQEPGDDQIPFEKPKLLANALATLQGSDEQIAVIKSRVGLYPRELERYAGLEESDLTIEPVGEFEPYRRDDIPSLGSI